MESPLTSENVAAKHDQQPTADVDQAAVHVDERAQRIQDLRNESLNQFDPLEANLGTITADLIEMASNLHHLIKSSWNPQTVTMEHLPEFQHAHDVYLRVVRQIDRLSQQQTRAREGRHRRQEEFVEHFDKS